MKMPAKKVGKSKAKKQSADKRIPPPPGPDASTAQLDEYFTKYSLEDMEKAGYVAELTKSESAWMEKLTKAAKKRVATKKERTQLNLALSPDQLERFTNYANRKHLPPSTLARAWVLERLDQELKEA